MSADAVMRLQGRRTINMVRRWFVPGEEIDSRASPKSSAPACERMKPDSHQMGHSGPNVPEPKVLLVVAMGLGNLQGRAQLCAVIVVCICETHSFERPIVLFLAKRRADRCRPAL